MKFGYARVSSADQSLERQMAALEGLCDEIVTDKVSGKDTQRDGLQSLLLRLRDGDMVLVKSVDRLARNTKELLELLENLTERGVSVQFLDNSMTFEAGNPTTKFMITMLAAVAELERGFIRQRQTEGIAIAKAAGRFKGSTKNADLREKVKKLLDSGLSAENIAKVAGCGRATVFRIKRELAASVTE
ncbi:recombinase family protein [Enterobacter hormaechei]|uniref:recombinase family protein n=1 Tax=Enterobacter hormaechei TaxID=158836 RepID=UPI0018C20900|nr:recombinase family protein [Enterobacter hormaechei]MBG0518611.1 recombinase family protein [Enterobacter hormaechei]